jgi:hypothetical protein
VRLGYVTLTFHPRPIHLTRASDPPHPDVPSGWLLLRPDPPSSPTRPANSLRWADPPRTRSPETLLREGCFPSTAQILPVRLILQDRTCFPDAILQSFKRYHLCPAHPDSHPRTLNGDAGTGLRKATIIISRTMKIPALASYCLGTMWHHYWYVYATLRLSPIYLTRLYLPFLQTSHRRNLLRSLLIPSQILDKLHDMLSTISSVIPRR